MKRDIQFIYFDLGNVLLQFDNGLACSQLADVAGVAKQEVVSFFEERQLQLPLERGEVSFDEVFEQFCEAIGRPIDKQLAQDAVCNIFTINSAIVPVVTRLFYANVPLGILSNTSSIHWDFVTSGRFGVLPSYFRKHILSFDIGFMKPEPEIYLAAAEASEVDPESIFFTDDRQENVDGALAFGFDALLFQSASSLAQSLVERGVHFNY